MLKLMYITNDPTVARIAADAGVDRIFLDLEEMGKEARQGHMDSVKSHHTFEDVAAVRRAIGPDVQLLVRINPFYEGTGWEIERALECGADILMLPMWRRAWEVEQFVRMVNGRATTLALLETKEADAALPEVLCIPGLDEIHIGLNDLHLSYGRSFLFELLADGTVDRICQLIRDSGKPFGFGGVGRPSKGRLRAEYILGEHYRLGSGAVILSRSFCNIAQMDDYEQIEAVFHQGISEIRQWEEEFSHWNWGQLMENHHRVGYCVEQILDEMRVPV